MKLVQATHGYINLDHKLTDQRRKLQPTDQEYVDGHRWMYGDPGERAASMAILARDKLMAPGFILPRIRLAPVAPYGHCMALCCPQPAGAEKEYLPGIWVFLHTAYHGHGAARLDSIDTSVLHELLHAELFQTGRDPEHRGAPWAERCQRMSNQLGFQIRIERPRSRRIKVDGKCKVITAPPDGCLPYDDLARWPRPLLNGAPLRALIERL